MKRENQIISCQEGKCFEIENAQKGFDTLFDANNIVHQIQRDLIRYQMR